MPSTAARSNATRLTAAEPAVTDLLNVDTFTTAAKLPWGAGSRSVRFSWVTRDLSPGESQPTDLVKPGQALHFAFGATPMGSFTSHADTVKKTVEISKGRVRTFLYEVKDNLNDDPAEIPFPAQNELYNIQRQFNGFVCDSRISPSVSSAAVDYPSPSHR
jgi:hypothetical protein